MDSVKDDLVSSLTVQRRHVAGILDGLGEDDLLRPVLPSGWCCAGLIRHLALDVERFWFVQVTAGEVMPDEGGAWDVPPGTTGAELLALYQEQIEAADAVIALTPLDAAPAWWPVEVWPDWRMRDLRATLLHVITETACHAGHLDAARELVDGRQWLAL